MPVRLAVIVVGLIYAIMLYLSGVQLDNIYKQAVAALPAIGTIIVIAWDVYLWRLPLLKQLIRRPRIDGLWRAELTPTAESHIPSGGNRGPIPAYLVITQTFWSVHVRQYTLESVSRSRAFFWQILPNADVESLNFVYENEPRQALQHRSNRHLGACIFDIVGRSPKSISGVYFTDRYTKGDMELEFVDRTRGYSSFQDADRHVKAVP